MTNYQKFHKFNAENGHLERVEYFAKLSELFDCQIHTVIDIWYAEQRSWFKPEMIDELLRLDKVPPGSEFRPNLCSGEFEWRDGRFVPE